jgi:hypothetical protein
MFTCGLSCPLSDSSSLLRRGVFSLIVCVGTAEKRWAGGNHNRRKFQLQGVVSRRQLPGQGRRQNMQRLAFRADDANYDLELCPVQAEARGRRTLALDAMLSGRWTNCGKLFGCNKGAYSIVAMQNVRLHECHHQDRILDDGRLAILLPTNR